MLLHHLFESPIMSYKVDDDFEDNQKKMKNTYKSNRDQYNDFKNFHHWHKSDINAIMDPASWENHVTTFAGTKYPFNIYVYQDERPNYDIWMSNFAMDVNHKNITPEMKNWFKKNDYTSRINIILANNLSDEAKVSIKSSWILAHRIGHALLLPDNNNHKTFFSSLIYVMKQYIKRIIVLAYDVAWESEDSEYFNNDIDEFMFEIYSKEMGHELGTMRSARNKRLVNGYEWYVETFVQWLLQGKVTLRPLPEIFDENVMTKDVNKRKTAHKLWAKMPIVFSRCFEEIMEHSVGTFHST